MTSGSITRYRGPQELQPPATKAIAKNADQGVTRVCRAVDAHTSHTPARSRPRSPAETGPGADLRAGSRGRALIPPNTSRRARRSRAVYQSAVGDGVRAPQTRRATACAACRASASPAPRGRFAAACPRSTSITWSRRKVLEFLTERSAPESTDHIDGDELDRDLAAFFSARPDLDVTMKRRRRR